MRLHPHYPKQGSSLSTRFVPGGGELDHLADAALVQFSTIRSTRAPHILFGRKGPCSAHLRSGGFAPPPAAGSSVSFIWSPPARETCLFLIRLFLESFIHRSVTRHYSTVGVLTQYCVIYFVAEFFHPRPLGAFQVNPAVPLLGPHHCVL